MRLTVLVLTVALGVAGAGCSKSTGTSASAAASAAADSSTAPVSSADLPIYPGAVPAYPGAPKNVLATHDDFATVVAWYKARLPAGSQDISTAEAASFSIDNNGTTEVVNVVSENGGTAITLNQNKM